MKVERKDNNSTACWKQLQREIATTELEVDDLEVALSAKIDKLEALRRGSDSVTQDYRDALKIEAIDNGPME